MTWELYTAISVLFLSISILLQRVILRGNKMPPLTYAINFQLMVTIIVFAFLLLQGFRVPDLGTVWPLALLCVVCFGVGHIFYAKTLQHVDASAFSILFATHAIWIMLFSILILGESLTAWQYLGTALIFISVGLVTQNWRSLLTNKGVMLGLTTGLLFGAAFIPYGIVGREVDPLSWAAFSFLGATIVSFVISPKKALHIRKYLAGSLLAKFAVLGVLYAIGSVSLLYAYILGDFSVVSPLRQTGIIVTVLLALIFMKTERTRIKAKIAAAISATAGIILIIV